MSKIVKNRSEIVFLYDVTDANPNGDTDENKPRIDDETGINIVTDVRLKRTIRDYFHKYLKLEIFVREEIDEELDYKLKTKEKLYEDYKDINDLLKRCIDVRLFGGTFALKSNQKDSQAFAITGPVQFKFGRSLHRVGEPKLVKGTTVLPSGEGKTTGTFWEYYMLPYSLICFYGIVNENGAEDTNLSNEDVDLLLEGMWNGTKNLITRSKIGHMPRLLLQVIYKEECYHIGELDKRIKLISEKRDEEIRRIEEVKLDLSSLIEELQKNKNKILKVRYKIDDNVNIIYKVGKQEHTSINEILEKSLLEQMKFERE